MKADNSYMKLYSNRKDSHPQESPRHTSALNPRNLQSIQQPLRDLDAQRHQICAGVKNLQRLHVKVLRMNPRQFTKSDTTSTQQ